MNAAERAARIEQYGRGYDELKATLDELPREMWQFKPSPKDWSIHEILIHLPDSETNSFSRFRAAVAEPGSRIFAYDQDVWAMKLNYHAQNWEDALQLMKYLRRVNYGLLKILPDDVWANTIDHPEYGIMTLDDVLVLYADHIPGHIQQMRDNYALWQERS